jgi:hypothetical protein
MRDGVPRSHACGDDHSASRYRVCAASCAVVNLADARLALPRRIEIDLHLRVDFTL